MVYSLLEETVTTPLRNGASSSSIDTLTDSADWWVASKSPQQIKALEALVGLSKDDEMNPPVIIDVLPTHPPKSSIVTSRALTAIRSGLSENDHDEPPRVITSRAAAIELDSAVIFERSSFDQDKKAAAAHFAEHDAVALESLPDQGMEESKNETSTRLLEQIQENLDEIERMEAVPEEEEQQQDNRRGLVVTTPPMKKGEGGGSSSCVTPQSHLYQSYLNSYSYYGSKEKDSGALSPRSGIYTDTTVMEDMSVGSWMSSSNTGPLEKSILPQLLSSEDEEKSKQALFQPSSSSDEAACVTEFSESSHIDDDNDDNSDDDDKNVVLGAPSEGSAFAAPTRKVSLDKKRKLLVKVGHLAKLMWKQLDERCKKLKKAIAALRAEKKKLQEELQRERQDKKEEVGKLLKALQEAQEEREEALLERDAILSGHEAVDKENEAPRTDACIGESGMKTMSLEAYEQLQLDLFSKHKENEQLRSELESLKDELEEEKVKLAMASQPKEPYVGFFSYFG